MEVYFAGTNSILTRIPIPAASRCRVRSEGFPLPRSSLLMSVWAMPVRSLLLGQSAFLLGGKDRLDHSKFGVKGIPLCLELRVFHLFVEKIIEIGHLEHSFRLR